MRAVDDDGAKQENKKGEVVWTCAVVLIFSSQLWSALKGLLAEDAMCVRQFHWSCGQMYNVWKTALAGVSISTEAADVLTWYVFFC